MKTQLAFVLFVDAGTCFGSCFLMLPTCYIRIGGDSENLLKSSDALKVKLPL